MIKARLTITQEVSQREEIVFSVYDKDWWLGKVLEAKFFSDNEDFFLSATSIFPNIIKLFSLFLATTGRSHNITSCQFCLV